MDSVLNFGSLVIFLIFNLILVLKHAVNVFIVSTCSIIHAGSMLSSQRLNKVMAEVSVSVYRWIKGKVISYT